MDHTKDPEKYTKDTPKRYRMDKSLYGICDVYLPQKLHLSRAKNQHGHCWMCWMSMGRRKHTRTQDMLRSRVESTTKMYPRGYLRRTIITYVGTPHTKTGNVNVVKVSVSSEGRGREVCVQHPCLQQYASLKRKDCTTTAARPLV